MERLSDVGASVDALADLRGPLTGYCYRLLGGAADADDAVQETLIRATASRERFDPDRGRLTTWVHRIATNICIDMMRAGERRGLATDMGPAAISGDIGAPRAPHEFVEPMPDDRLLDTGDPAETAARRETVRLAFVAALQHLAPRQRAILVLRDVLAFTAQETADILDTTVTAANSGLQRARARLADVRPEPVDPYVPGDPAQQALLDRYVTAFEAHDVSGLIELLRADARSSMPPFAWWLSGAATIAGTMASSDACAGARLLPTTINGAAGFGQYRPTGDGELRPFALVRLEFRDGQVADIINFLGTADRFPEFGLPPTVGDRSNPGQPSDR